MNNKLIDAIKLMLMLVLVLIAITMLEPFVLDTATKQSVAAMIYLLIVIISLGHLIVNE